MYYLDFDHNKAFIAGSSSGSSPNMTYSLDMENTLIAIESVAMPTGGFLRDIFKKFIETDVESAAQPEVIRSLSRSVEEHADVWAELSKY